MENKTAAKIYWNKMADMYKERIYEYVCNPCQNTLEIGSDGMFNKVYEKYKESNSSESFEDNTNIKLLSLKDAKHPLPFDEQLYNTRSLIKDESPYGLARAFYESDANAHKKVAFKYIWSKYKKKAETNSIWMILKIF